ncbi:hypothetical protein LLG90_00905 [Aromatoleum toluclasticum]|uniref:hypothetical protein n=1 Tax=Aromatoleum toluclasticum TaxID=92003 RepID=UPI001D1891F7|nr:hypothetical protein [Aromatoleum toluclasticum]MCC4113902.1 hypothetical protein [Aromatoleum toluclasticum]
MNIPQLPFDGDGRPRWPKIAATVWLLLVSVLAVVNSVGLSRLAEQSRTSSQDAHVQALATRVGDLEQQAAAVKRHPTPITEADLDAARHALDERLVHVERALSEDAYAGDMRALQARLGAIEARLKKSSPSAAVAPRRTVEAAKPKPLEPPFNVAGLELRGGERFLSIAEPGATSLPDVRLLREGDSAGAWQLQAIEARAAMFRVDGQTLRVAVP